MTAPSSHPADALLALVYGELSPEELRTVQRHVDGCAECTATVADYRGVRSAATSLPRELPAPSGLESVLHYGERAAARARVRRGLRWVWPLAAGALAVGVGVVAMRPPAGKLAADAVAVREPTAPGPSVSRVSPPAEEGSKLADRLGAPQAPAPVPREAVSSAGSAADVSSEPRAPAARAGDKVLQAPAKSERRVAAGASVPAAKPDARLRSEEAPRERTDIARQAEAEALSGSSARDEAMASSDANLAKKSVAASTPVAKGKEALPMLAGAAAPARPASVAAASIASSDGGVAASGGVDEARRATLYVRLRETQGAQLLPVLVELCGLEARLGHVKDALGVCQRVVREYPGTPEAAAAQRQVDLLRGGG